MDKLYLAKISWYIKGDWKNYTDVKLVKGENKEDARKKIFTFYKSTDDRKPTSVDIDDIII